MQGRNWTALWKPTIDVLGPLLGSDPRPHKPHGEARDGRITEIALHQTVIPVSEKFAHRERWAMRIGFLVADVAATTYPGKQAAASFRADARFGAISMGVRYRLRPRRTTWNVLPPSAGSRTHVRTSDIRSDDRCRSAARRIGTRRCHASRSTPPEPRAPSTHRFATRLHGCRTPSLATVHPGRPARAVVRTKCAAPANPIPQREWEASIVIQTNM